MSGYEVLLSYVAVAFETDVPFQNCFIDLTIVACRIDVYSLFHALMCIYMLLLLDNPFW